MIYKLKVKPNSCENLIIKKSDYLEVSVKAKPEKGKANLSVLKLLSKYFNKPVAEIKLRGLTSKNKSVEIK